MNCAEQLAGREYALCVCSPLHLLLHLKPPCPPSPLSVVSELRRLNIDYAEQLAEQNEAIGALSDQHRAAVERVDDLQVTPWGGPPGINSDNVSGPANGEGHLE